MVKEDTPASQEAAPEPELAPYLLESARSSRSRCRTCKRKIEKDKLRLGILLEGPFGTGYLWHHLTCAARRRIEDVEAAYAQKAFEEGLAVPPLSELQALEEKAAKERAERKEPPYVERAPSGRSRCKHCGEAIAQGDTAHRVGARNHLRQPGSGDTDQRASGMRAGGARLGDCLTEVGGFDQQLHQNSELEASVVDDALAEIGDLVAVGESRPPGSGGGAPGDGPSGGGHA